MSKSNPTGRLISAIREHAIPLSLSSPAKDYSTLLDAIGDNVCVVMIGEASHGTAEFYRERALITQRLIEEKGFTMVAVEADWPDAYRINRYVQKINSRDKTPIDCLGDFKRFPRWMWRNAEMLPFIRWLRNFNSKIPDPRRRIAFYGIDLYSLHTSAEAVLQYLSRVDPDSAKRARRRYECFLQYGEDTMTYAYYSGMGIAKSCESEVVSTLRELNSHMAEYVASNGFCAEDELFFTKINAEVVKDAEEYYRTMLGSGVESWNRRDAHMARVVKELLTDKWRTGIEQHATTTASQPAHKHKIVLWAHNSHLGDARATDMGRERGEWNVGQLMREEYGNERVYNIGFTTHGGTVTAADNWDEPAKTFSIVPGRTDSYEGIHHEASSTVGPNYLLLFKRNNPDGRKVDANPELVAAERATGDKLERAIGVIYKPRTEIVSHYFRANIVDQFDAVIHIDTTSALMPIDSRSFLPPPETDENVPELFPAGV